MKAIIGKPISRFISRVHENHMNKTYGFVDWPAEKYYTKTDRFMEKLEDSLQVLYNLTVNQILDRMKQTEKIKIDPWDTWNMDSTLSPIILPMLIQLKKKQHGAPFVDDEDVPEELRSTNAPPKENEWDTDDLHFDRWNWVMDQMIWSFEKLCDEDDDSQFHTGNIDFQSKPVDKDGNEVPRDEAVLFKLVRGPNDTSHYDREGYQKHQEKIQNGLRLFGKYYRALWD